MHPHSQHKPIAGGSKWPCFLNLNGKRGIIACCIILTAGTEKQADAYKWVQGNIPYKEKDKSYRDQLRLSTTFLARDGHRNALLASLQHIDAVTSTAILWLMSNNINLHSNFKATTRAFLHPDLLHSVPLKIHNCRLMDSVLTLAELLSLNSIEQQIIGILKDSSLRQRHACECPIRSKEQTLGTNVITKTFSATYACMTPRGDWPNGLYSQTDKYEMSCG